MFRSIATLALSLFLLAEASAQTTPAASTKATAKSQAKAARKVTKEGARAAKKAEKERARLARKGTTPAKAVAVDNDGWPPIEDASVVASTATVEQTSDYGVTPVHMRHEDVVYAAPGTAVRIVTTKKMVPYSVRSDRKKAASPNTLGQ
ncbi:hypothetical protein GCM10023185_40380 [Hymenobacter saemangeumensis]|uniref:Uncharacterized protein n=1 Tax=Hymenobacter saemangeumensis TaxID=1084522 RepID=A0ABP8IR21_9BACT